MSNAVCGPRELLFSINNREWGTRDDLFKDICDVGDRLMAPEGGGIASLELTPEGYIKSPLTIYFAHRKFAGLVRDFPLRRGQIRPAHRHALEVKDLILAAPQLGLMVKNALGSPCDLDREDGENKRNPTLCRWRNL